MTALLARFLDGFWGPAVLHAVLLTAAFPPFGGVLFAVLAWAVLLASIRRRGGRKAGRQALVAALLFFVTGLWWIAPLSVASWIGVAIWCACWEGIFGYWVGRFLRRVPDGRRSWWVLVAPVEHLVVDICRTVILTGFPWFLTGYAGWNVGWLLDGADVLGVHGATLALLLPAAALAEIVVRALPTGDDAAPLRPAWKEARVVAPTLAIWAALGIWSFAKPAILRRPGPRVLLIQGNIAQKTKEDLVKSGEERPDTKEWLERHVALIREGFDANVADTGSGTDGNGSGANRPIDLVIWPETMVPVFAYLPLDDPRNTKALWKPLALWSRGAYTLAGMMAFDPKTGKKANAMVLIGPDADPVGGQHKQHLTPGGETLLFLDYLPAGLRQRIEQWFIEVAGYVPSLTAGEGPVPLPVALRDPSANGATATAGVIICYEVLFPELARAHADARADFLVNSSNYGWFAGSPQMEQALGLACFRAAETRRAMVLASNNGPSGVVGPDGRVEKILFRDKKMTDVAGALVADVPLSSGSTPFLMWGERAAALLGLLGVIAGLTLERVRRPS